MKCCSAFVRITGALMKKGFGRLCNGLNLLRASRRTFPEYSPYLPRLAICCTAGCTKFPTATLSASTASAKRWATDQCSVPHAQHSCTTFVNWQGIDANCWRFNISATDATTPSEFSIRLTKPCNKERIQHLQGAWVTWAKSVIYIYIYICIYIYIYMRTWTNQL